MSRRRDPGRRGALWALGAAPDNREETVELSPKASQHRSRCPDVRPCAAADRRGEGSFAERSRRDPADASTQIARAAMQGAESETAHRNEQRRFGFDIQA